ncbi:MAG: hypothetical protein JWM76_2049 [Pseudonocardiales bacterium]|nr:hypothetical protein [Pseudonocardiales bacterium]
MAVSAGASTVRYGVVRAPDGLGFVEDFINTLGKGAPPLPDQLVTLRDAREWFRIALSGWALDRDGVAPTGSLVSGDLPALRALRADLHSLLLVGQASPAAAHRLGGSVDYQVTPTGVSRPVPSGRGSGWVAATVALEIREAQIRGTWRRLKICRNSLCHVAFYDRSRNNSGVWHDLKICGNPINLRSHRARRAAAAES